MESICNGSMGEEKKSFICKQVRYQNNWLTLNLYCVLLLRFFTVQVKSSPVYFGWKRLSWKGKARKKHQYHKIWARNTWDRRIFIFKSCLFPSAAVGQSYSNFWRRKQLDKPVELWEAVLLEEKLHTAVSPASASTLLGDWYSFEWKQRFLFETV